MTTARTFTACLLCGVCLWLANCGGPPTPEELWQVALPERPSTYGLTLPEPVHMPAYSADSNVNLKAVEKIVSLILRIDAHGRVTDLRADNPEDYLYAACYDDYLRSIPFDPGFSDTVRIEMLLPVTMQIGDRGDTPELFFPVFSGREVIEYDLYARGLEMNGLELPSLESFPSYNCDIDSFSTEPIYRYLLMQVDLDSVGRPTAIETILSTYPRYEEKLRTAVNWARYTPLKASGVARPARCYVLISFFPLCVYPTAPLDSVTLEQLPLLERLRVRIFPDTLGLMAKPVPASFWQTKVRDKKDWHTHYDLFSSRLAIDSLGLATHLKTTGRDRWNRQLVKNLAEEVLFYPALDFRGRPRSYRGLFYLERLPKRPVRMWITWLPESRLESNF
ncbi:MAG: hypothetical protein GY867_08210 [bacterium]|nr:hypothetical protein [bacterium]